jgi:hypothetical protein
MARSGGRLSPMISAAAWTANFTSWPHLANWLNNSNLASLVMGIVLPGALLVAWHLRATRTIHDKTIAELKIHIDQAHQEAVEREARLRAEFLAKDNPPPAQIPDS